MRHSLDLNLVGSESYLKPVKDEVPNKEDAIVDTELYNEPTISEEIDEETGDPTGNMEMIGMIRFIEDADRETVKEKILDLSGTFDKAEVGSRMALHTCYHDENPPKPCEETTIWEVTSE